MLANAYTVLFDSNGVEMAVSNGVAVPLAQRGLIVAGTDGVSTRFVLTDATGRVSTFDNTTAALANGAETVVGAAAVSVVAANAARKSALVQNVGLGIIRVGIAGVTATTGVRLEPGETVIFNTPWCPAAALFAIRDGVLDSIALAQEVT